MENITRNIPDNLPEVEFVDTDTEKLVNKLIIGYEEIMGRTLYPADPVRAFILWLASIIIQERIQINESAKQNLPRYAVGKNLDSISELFHNTYRLKPTAATTTLRFVLTKIPENEYIITDKLEVTIDGNINFITRDNIIFKAGDDTADVVAECTKPGTVGNGFVPGQINRLVSIEFLYFKEVFNITESNGGSEEENDTTFYNRMRESEESYTTAGPLGSYKYHTKTVSSLICDVSVSSAQPGIVDVRILLQGGKLPDEELINKVKDHLNADYIRPLTDKVLVDAPTTVEFDIEAVYYIPKDKTTTKKEIERAVKLATENYILWQTSRIGRDINPSYFNAVVMASGIKRIEIVSPQFMEITEESVAVIRNCNVVFGGVENE